MRCQAKNRMTNEVKKLRTIELHVGYACKLISELEAEMNDKLTLAEQIHAKKVLGLPLTREEKSFIRAIRRLEK